MDGKSLRQGGPIGKAPSSGSGAMSQSMAVTANTTARPCPAHQSGTNSKMKESGNFPSPGELGARGHGGAC